MLGKRKIGKPEKNLINVIHGSDGVGKEKCHIKAITNDIYYSKFDMGQNFNFVCRRSCVSDTKSFMIYM